MLITFQFNAYSTVKEFSFSSAFVEMSGLGEGFVFSSTLPSYIISFAYR